MEIMTKQVNIEKLSLADFADAVSSSQNITEARKKMSFALGATIEVTGEVIKKATRHEHLRLLIQPGNSAMSVFAEFPDPTEAEKIAKMKIRKTSKVSLVGELLAFGFASVNLTNCRLTN